MDDGPLQGLKNGLPPDDGGSGDLKELGLSKQEFDDFFKQIASEEYRRIMIRFDEIEEKINKILKQGD